MKWQRTSSDTDRTDMSVQKNVSHTVVNGIGQLRTKK